MGDEELIFSYRRRATSHAVHIYMAASTHMPI